MTDRIDKMHNDLAEAREAAEVHYQEARWHAAMYRNLKRLVAKYEEDLPAVVEAEDVAAAAWGAE